MKRKIGIGTTLFVLFVVGVAVGSFLGMLSLALYYQAVAFGQSTTVEVEEVPVEETRVRPIEGLDLSREMTGAIYTIEGEADESKIVTLGVGVWEITGASDASPIMITNLDHSAGATWNASREVLVVIDEDDMQRLGNRESAGSVMPAGRTRFKKRTDRSWRISIQRALCPSDFSLERRLQTLN